jgi:hypothetical protein
MNKLVSLLGVLVAAAVLTACGTSTRVLNSNAQSVSVVFDGDESTMADVNRMATAECQKNSRTASLKDISQVKDGRVANYDCKQP